MPLPAIQGLIRRRILINFRVDPDVIARHLPAPFRPKLLRGSAMAGICLIRFEGERPRFLPSLFGQSSENAAHRIAVRWNDVFGEPHEGVFIPRRDTNSRVNQLLGGRLFPGVHHRAKFDVCDENGSIDFRMTSEDGQAAIRLRAHEATELPVHSRFQSLDEASSFFERGTIGYSSAHNPKRLDGVRLVPKAWHVVPLHVDELASSFFDDAGRFPTGSVEFDCALLMRNIQHEWHTIPSLETGCCDPAATPAPGLVGTA
jgi:hypothetical protein